MGFFQKSFDLKVTFKQVGQGDSIVLEWNDLAVRKIAFIDCNEIDNGQTNPSIEHLISSGIKEIEFILLSHPHTDHFSGMRKLIEYCASNDIRINKFIHTSFSDVRILRASVRGHVATSELERLYGTVDSCYRSGAIIDVLYATSSSRSLCLNSDIILEFLAPRYREISAATKQMLSRSANSDIKINTYEANYFSTIIKISQLSELF